MMPDRMAPGSGQEPCREQEGSTGLCSSQHKHLSSRLFPELATLLVAGMVFGSCEAAVLPGKDMPQKIGKQGFRSPFALHRHFRWSCK